MSLKEALILISIVTVSFVRGLYDGAVCFFQVPMLPSRNLRLGRRILPTSEECLKGESIGEQERCDGRRGTLRGGRGVESEEGADESGAAAASVVLKKAVKAKPNAWKGVITIDHRTWKLGWRRLWRNSRES
jgi:hypothetical protein